VDQINFRAARFYALFFKIFAEHGKK
jgi:hypothetical protein